MIVIEHPAEALTPLNAVMEKGSCGLGLQESFSEPEQRGCRPG
jgi:hypothetical protein